MLFFVLFTWLVNGDALSLGMPFCLRCLAGVVRRPEGLFGYAELSLAYSLWYWWHFLYSVVLDAVLERVISLRGGFFASYIRYLASLPGLRRECYLLLLGTPLHLAPLPGLRRECYNGALGAYLVGFLLVFALAPRPGQRRVCLSPVPGHACIWARSRVVRRVFGLLAWVPFWTTIFPLRLSRPWTIPGHAVVGFATASLPSGSRAGSLVFVFSYQAANLLSSSCTTWPCVSYKR